jgi:hypothetical protein
MAGIETADPKSDRAGCDHGDRSRTTVWPAMTISTSVETPAAPIGGIRRGDAGQSQSSGNRRKQHLLEHLKPHCDSAMIYALVDFDFRT